MTKIVVLGAGVIGLTTALELKRANPSYDITIVAAHLPGDLSPEYTSPFAGANWHSFASHADSVLQQLDLVGYRRFLDLANDPKSGVWTVKNLAFVTGQVPEQIDDWLLPYFKNHTEEFTELTGADLIGDTVRGFSFKGIIITVPIYLNYLLQQNLELGNVVRRVPKVTSLVSAKVMHAKGNADFVINCAGVLVRNLTDLNDPARNYLIRGQVVHVRNCATQEVEVEGFSGLPDEMLYLMPRKEGGCIIGGCFQVDNENIEEDKELTQRILERAQKYVPELTNHHIKNNPTSLDVIRVNVGFRPFREGGARIERDLHRPWLVHNYGAGGGGYQGSYGMAAKTVQIINSIASKSKF